MGDGSACRRGRYVLTTVDRTTVAAEPGAGGGASREWNSQTCPMFCSNSPNVSSESDDESGAGHRRAKLP